MFEILKAILFGILEGITEWLPISSTGHLILLNNFLKFDIPNAEQFFSMFEVVIQFGAILAVVILFWSQIWPFSKEEKNYIKQDTFMMWIKIVVACIPAVIVELLWGDQIEELFYNYISIAIALIVFGVAFLIVENLHNGKEAKVNNIADITFQSAFIIGMFQLIAAVFPGTSRSGATIIGALIIGISRGVAAEFTFFLAIPVMFGASLMKLLDFGFHFTTTEAALLTTGCIVSFVVSIIVIRFFMGYIKKHDFKVFGWYRIALGIVIIAYYLAK